ncbi:MAG: tripartite tricarboxylate transporter substrate binding protein [Burkholderiales bacterium]|nr:MAG: tripartite tricarboxylate transporter substrate binding protein [Burkholderiales bacterium]
MNAKLLATFCVAMCTALSPATAQEAFPSKPIRIIVPLGAGGSSDLGARLVARKLSEELKQPVVVENRPGGNQVIGIGAVKNAPADGYTLLWTTSGIFAAAVVNKVVPFDALKDFDPITLGGRTNAVVIVQNAVPVTDLKSFVDYAKKNPGKLNFASTGGSVTLLIQHFMQTVGIDMPVIAYKSQPASMNDFISGQTQVMIDRPSVYKAQIAMHGRAVAVTGAERDRDIPTVPTVAEQGYKGFEIDTWQAMFIRSGTPADRLSKIKAAMAKVMADPELRRQFVEIGVEPAGSSAEALAALSRSDAARWKAVAAKSKFEAE